MSTYYSYTGDSACVPNPYRPDLSPARLARLNTAADRHNVIAEAAYLIAQRRGFVPGHELSDWLEAEREVDEACGLIEPSPRWDD